MLDLLEKQLPVIASTGGTSPTIPFFVANLGNFIEGDPSNNINNTLANFFNSPPPGGKTDEVDHLRPI